MNRLTKNLIYLGIITAVEVGVFAHYNHLLTVAKSQTTVATTAPVQQVKPTTLSGIQPLAPNLVAVSSDGQRLAYVSQDKKLIAIDVSTGKTLYSLQLLMKPVYLSWIRNDSLFIGTEVPDGNLKDLRLSTITLSSGQLRLIHVFSQFAKDSTFQNVTFSPYTNDVYVLISSKVASVMYHYDTNGNLSHVDLGGRYVSRAGTTSTSNIVYFQDFAAGTPNMLMRDNRGNITVLHRNAALLRVVGNTLYYGLLDSNGNVTQVESYAAPADAGASMNATSGGSSSSSSTSASGTSHSKVSTSSSTQSSSKGGRATTNPGTLGSAGSPKGTGIGTSIGGTTISYSGSTKSTNSSQSGGTTGVPGVSTLVMTLPEPTPPSQVYVNDNHNIIVVDSNGIDDLTTKQHIKDATDVQTVLRSDALILISPDGSVEFFT